MQSEQWQTELDRAVEIAQRLKDHPKNELFPKRDVRELVQCVLTLNETYGSEPKESAGYAELSWSPEDVQTLREDLTDEQAEGFLDRNERHLRDRLVEHGWDVMSTLLDMDDEIPPTPPDSQLQEILDGD